MEKTGLFITYTHVITNSFGKKIGPNNIQNSFTNKLVTK